MLVEVVAYVGEGVRGAAQSEPDLGRERPCLGVALGMQGAGRHQSGEAAEDALLRIEDLRKDLGGLPGHGLRQVITEQVDQAGDLVSETNGIGVRVSHGPPQA
ncbi:hypothetical protein ABZ707_30090 [Streptomyces sp. NPDC006923]|uniref:hypothetical protein n=1 Tax=Streptomyces sp. NPDC006923 TaxID=3155355 RepID=UPI0033FEC987